MKTEVGDVMRKDELFSGRAADQGMTQKDGEQGSESDRELTMNER